MSEMRPKGIDPLAPGARAIQGLRAGVVTRVVAGGIDYALVIGTTFGTWLAWSVLLFLVDPRDYVVPEWPFY